jgi:hypothetical protein
MEKKSINHINFFEVSTFSNNIFGLPLRLADNFPDADCLGRGAVGDIPLKLRPHIDIPAKVNDKDSYQ